VAERVDESVWKQVGRGDEGDVWVGDESEE